MWRLDGGGLRCVAGPAPRFNPAPPLADGYSDSPEGRALWLAPAGVPGWWLEVCGGDEARLASVGAGMAPVLASQLQLERQRARIAEELAGRYEEIDLLYAITEILGRTVRLEEAAQTIVQEVASVVGARRASIMVIDEDGTPPAHRRREGLQPRRRLRGEGGRSALGGRARLPGATRRGERRRGGCAGPRGRPQVSRPVVPGRAHQLWRARQPDYAASASSTSPTGSAATASRPATASCSPPSRARWAPPSRTRAWSSADRRQQQLRHELALAHDLQLKLLPSPSVLQGDAQVAARCMPADSVGGDFYTFGRLGHGRVGVMLGDVSSHGFGAALIMAHILSAAGIHAASAAGPGQALAALLDSVGSELHSTDMYFSVFHGVLDPAARHAPVGVRRTSARLPPAARRRRPSASRPPAPRSGWWRRARSPSAR